MALLLLYPSRVNSFFESDSYVTGQILFADSFVFLIAFDFVARSRGCGRYGELHVAGGAGGRCVCWRKLYG